MFALAAILDSTFFIVYISVLAIVALHVLVKGRSVISIDQSFHSRLGCLLMFSSWLEDDCHQIRYVATKRDTIAATHEFQVIRGLYLGETACAVYGIVTCIRPKNVRTLSIIHEYNIDPPTKLHCMNITN